MNLTDYLTARNNTVNGKALRKPELNLVAKLDKLDIYINDADEKRVTLNPITGFRTELDAFVSILVRWTYAVYSTYDPMVGGMTFGGHKIAIGTYDRVRSLILSLDSEAYYNFID